MSTPDVPPTSPRPPRRFPKISIFCRIFFEASAELWGVHWASINLPRHHRRLPAKYFFFEFLTHTPCEMEPKSSIFEKASKSGHRKRFTASRPCHANRRAISLGSVKSQLISPDGSRVRGKIRFHGRSARFCRLGGRLRACSDLPCIICTGWCVGWRHLLW